MKAISLLLTINTASVIVVQGTTFDAAADFSHSSNPVGEWSYGWYDGSFHLMTDVHAYVPDVYFWQANLNGPLGEPTVSKNEGSSVLVINGSTTYAPGVMAFHPGRAGQQAVLRWTAPFSGVFSVAARFKGLDTFTTSNVSVRDDGAVVASGDINGPAGQLSYFDQMTVSANSTIDFLVGFGSNNTFYFDSTRIDVLITDHLLSSPPIFQDIDITGLPVVHLDWYSEGGPIQNVPDNSNSLALLLVSFVGLIASGHVKSS